MTRLTKLDDHPVHDAGALFRRLLRLASESQRDARLIIDSQSHVWLLPSPHDLSGGKRHGLDPSFFQSNIGEHLGCHLTRVTRIDFVTASRGGANPYRVPLQKRNQIPSLDQYAFTDLHCRKVSASYSIKMCAP